MKLRSWRVSSGNHIERNVMATDAWVACIKALKRGKFKGLGFLMEAKPVKGYAYYCSAERICRAAGMWTEWRTGGKTRYKINPKSATEGAK